MGLSASQARLLSITARLSDNELHSQQIANAKIRLADQSQEASRDYVNALDTQKLMYTIYDAKGNASKVNLTPAVMYEYSELKNQYGISNNAGQLLITSKDAQNYKNSNTLEDFLRMYVDDVKLPNPEYSDVTQKISNQENIEASLSNKHVTYTSELNEYNTSLAEKQAILDGYNATLAEKQNILEQQYASRSEKQSEIDVIDEELGNLNNERNTHITQRDNYQTQLNNLNPPDINNYKHYVEVPGSNPYAKLFDPSEDSRIPDFFMYDDIEPYGSGNVKKSDLTLLVDFLGYGIFTASYGGSFETQDSVGGVTFSNSTQDFNMRDETFAPNMYVRWEDNAGNIYYQAAQVLNRPENAQLKQDIIDLTYERCECFTYNEELYAAADDDGDMTNNDFNWTELLNDDDVVAEFYSLFKRLEEMCSGEATPATGYWEWNTNGESDYNTAYDAYQTNKQNLQDLIAQENAAIAALDQQISNMNSSKTSKQAELDAINTNISTTQDEISVVRTNIDGVQAEISELNYAIRSKKSDISLVEADILDAQNLIRYYQNNLPDQYNILQDDTKLQWYINLWYRINGSSDYNTNLKVENGVVVLDTQATSNSKWKILDDSELNNASWLQYNLEQGLITIEQVQNTNQAETGIASTKWQTKSYTSCIDIQFVDDETAVARAEAIYTKKLNEIEAKDKKYDSDIKKLDTEHNALQTEYDSVKSVIEKNVERSFKAFS